MATKREEEEAERVALLKVIEVLAPFDIPTRQRLWAAARAFFGEAYAVTRGEK